MSLSDSFARMSDFDFNDIDFDNVGEWPAAIKVIICVVVFCVVAGFGHQFYFG